MAALAPMGTVADERWQMTGGVVPAGRADHTDRGGRIAVLWRSLGERFRTSLFGLPSLWVLGSVVLWLVMREVDDLIDSTDAPSALITTVDSARALLGAVASGTIAAASVVFSLTLVAIQLSSSTYSSRVLRLFLRDRFQQNMIGLVLATFFYSLLVLRDVRGPLAEGGDANVPGASVALATVLALVAVLALLASISHTAMSVRVSHVSSSVRADTREVILARLGPVRESTTRHPGTGDDGAGDSDLGEVDREATTVEPSTGDQTAAQPPGALFDLQAPGVVPSPLLVAAGERFRDATARPGHGDDRPVSHDLGEPVSVEATAGGWMQQISVEALTGCVPAGSVLRIEVAVGTYVFEGSPLVTVWFGASAAQDDPDTTELRTAIRAAFRTGRERTMQQDIAFGLTMLEDITLRALSPGINDPNTARATIPQMGELLLELLARDLPPARVSIDEVVVLRDAVPSHLDYLEASFGQIRRVAQDQPEVLLTMVRTLVAVAEELTRRGIDAPAPMSALRVSMSRLAPDHLASGSDMTKKGTWSDPSDPAVIAAVELLEATPWFRSRPRP